MTKKQYENTSIRGGESDGDCLLPVVVFSFSKSKCEEIADFLMGQDLLTGKEKGEVRYLCGVYMCGECTCGCGVCVYVCMGVVCGCMGAVCGCIGILYVCMGVVCLCVGECRG
jgi:hypothetical protein